MYIVYKTTCLINQKFYIGVHKTECLNDGYLGSGKLLKLAIEKYGVENFKKEILFIYENSEEAFQKEYEIISESLLESKNCYNLKRGGNGGWHFVHENGLTNKNKTRDHYIMMSKIMHENMKQDEEKYIKYIEKQRKSHIGKTVSDETKRKISETLKKRNAGKST